MKGPSRVKRLVFLLLGFLCLGLGCVGAFLPILPTVPFFLATVFFFSRSSQKLRDWFAGTRLYERTVSVYLKRKGMTAKTKASVLTCVTLVMGVGFAFMGAAPAARILLAVVWACHVLYFLFGVKTLRTEEPAEACEASEPSEKSEASEPSSLEAEEQSPADAALPADAE